MDKKVAIVGVGALGSHLAVLLRNAAHMTLIDYDRIEKKNVLSQFHATGSVGKNKAVALQQALKFLFGTRSDAVPNKLEIGNVRELLSGADLVVDCVDNAEARKLIQDYCVMNSKPCLHGALAANGEFGQVIWTPGFRVDAGDSGAATCEDGEHLPFISAVSSYLATAAQAFLKSGKRRGFQVSASGQVVLV